MRTLRVNFNKFYLFGLFLIVTAVLAVCISVHAQTAAPPLIKPETTALQNLKIFNALWQRVNTRYFDPNFNGVNWQQIRQLYRPKAERAPNKQALLIILRQMLAELKTSHLYVWQTVSEKKIENRIRADFDRKHDTLELGYGFSFKFIEGKPVVTEIEPNASAKSNGVKAGWTLVTIDNVPITGKGPDIDEVNEGLKSNFLFSDAENQEHRLTLTADWMAKRPVRSSRLIRAKAGYIKFDGFISGTGKWLRDEMGKLDSPNAIVLDLRGNRGGYVDEVRNCLAQFFATDTELGSFVERTGKADETKIKGKRDHSF
ncbi:MAG TPA: S41 family peptidase, partial [Pyrinomonadaceae bacterium]|nr:S41 family peptidase [Pyrinomonadaceae bacterium]